MKKVVLSGASGFIGRHVAEELSGAGYEVYMLSKGETGVPAVANAVSADIDLFDYAAVAKFFGSVRPEYLLHLAWDTTHGKYWTSDENFRWLQASVELAASFHKNGGRRLVAAGTCAEYDWNYNFMSEFTTPRNPKTPYGICKNALFQLLESYSKLKGLSFSWARLFFLFGPYEKRARLIPHFICSLLKKKRARCENPEMVRDFLYVKDAAAAFRALLDSEAQGPFNISSAVGLKLGDIVEAIAEITGGKELIDYTVGAEASDQPLCLTGDNSRLIRETGWRVRTELKEALAQSIQWWKDELAGSGELK
ncbi:MAG: hypothetical protein A2008_12210 [Candidatus Wallbacteria bacterium GWC2_49_35]|uniref:NAD-dependent epimerase/dehydratase domain-containing protein n=1 Tax=Candidatus Wallbacteria bacterium GWC2_49_35 TaxID=1817813 RepID=A0A1F7WUE2_9BACT|nr:MAG: hypothetical protein A2008_12210 [Candidatus Wallbacteria bacterium GWC2_49_35]